METQPLTERQKKLYRILNDEINKHGFPPTVRELLPLLGVKSTSLVYAELKNLEKAGYIQKDPTKPRAITITKNVDKYSATGATKIGVPLIDHLDRDKNRMIIKEYVPFTKQNSADFAYRMKGFSLVESGIYDGDLLYFSDTAVNEGDIILAYADTATIVAELGYNENGSIVLKPKNASIHDIQPKNYYIAGKMVALLRFF